MGQIGKKERQNNQKFNLLRELESKLNCQFARVVFKLYNDYLAVRAWAMQNE